MEQQYYSFVASDNKETEYSGAASCRNNGKMLLLLAALLFVCCNAMAVSRRIFTDTIPIEWHNNHILMPVTINHELRHLVFDTGVTGILLWGDKKPFKTKWTAEATDAKNHTKNLEMGLVLAEFGSRRDSFETAFTPLPADTTVRKAMLHTGDGCMGFSPLIRCGRNYFVKVDLRKGIMIVSNDRRRARETDGVKVSYRKCDALPTFKVTIGKGHRTRLPFDSGAIEFCTVKTSLLDKWEKADSTFKASKIFDDVTTDALAAHDTAFTKRRVKAYKCDFSIKTFTVKDATIMDDPTGAASVGSEIFQKAADAFDPWHKKIIFQPYGQ